MAQKVIVPVNDFTPEDLADNCAFIMHALARAKKGLRALRPIMVSDVAGEYEDYKEGILQWFALNDKLNDVADVIYAIQQELYRKHGR